MKSPYCSPAGEVLLPSYTPFFICYLALDIGPNLYYTFSRVPRYTLEQSKVSPACALYLQFCISHAISHFSSAVVLGYAGNRGSLFLCCVVFIPRIFSLESWFRCIDCFLLLIFGIVVSTFCDASVDAYWRGFDLLLPATAHVMHRVRQKLLGVLLPQPLQLFSLLWLVCGTAYAS